MKQVMMFGPNSLAKAQAYSGKQKRSGNFCSGYYWRRKSLVVLRAPDRRYAVCTLSTAMVLERQGFRVIA
jgi:hypothetical protein